MSNKSAMVGSVPVRRGDKRRQAHCRGGGSACPARRESHRTATGGTACLRGERFAFMTGAAPSIRLESIPRESRGQHHPLCKVLSALRGWHAGNNTCPTSCLRRARGGHRPIAVVPLASHFA